MNLKKKKALAARTFNVGVSKIEFVKPRLEEIKEAITKQDIRDLHKDGAIIIRQKKGRLKTVKRRRKSFGRVRKVVNKRKQEYMILTRKLRKYLSEIKSRLTEKERVKIRKLIRNRAFKSKSQLMEYLAGTKK
jgi:large subunit ribosomal protein L19e